MKHLYAWVREECAPPCIPLNLYFSLIELTPHRHHHTHTQWYLPILLHTHQLVGSLSLLILENPSLKESTSSIPISIDMTGHYVSTLSNNSSSGLSFEVNLWWTPTSNIQLRISTKGVAYQWPLNFILFMARKFVVTLCQFSQWHSGFIWNGQR